MVTCIRQSGHAWVKYAHRYITVLVDGRLLTGDLIFLSKKKSCGERVNVDDEILPNDKRLESKNQITVAFKSYKIDTCII